MNEKINRLASWMSGKKVGPLSLEIWPTNRCNLKCKMCGTWANRRKMEKSGKKYNEFEEMKNEVPKERLIKLIEEAKELDVKECLITGGGEPFVRKELTLDLMEKIKFLEMFGNINTNGTLLKEKDIIKILEMDWDMMMFSVDAPDAKNHDYIRGVKGTFGRIKKNLLLFKHQKKKLKKDKPLIVFNAVLSNRLFGKIEKLIKFASRVNCENITFIPIIPYDKLAEELEMSKDQKVKLQTEIAKLIKISDRLGVKTNLNELNFSIQSEMKELILKEVKNSPMDIPHSPCFEPFLHFLVKANGETTFCCMVEDSKENIKEKSLREIWFGRYFKKCRKDFINKKIKEECRYCVFSQFMRNKEIREVLSLKL
jgi:MoaA/NifB/PqqE/SkfB family radical SAM enzyme